MSASSRVVIIDGNYFAHRFYHGRPALRGPGQREIGALCAYGQWLAELLGDQRFTHWALVLDHPGPSFRNERYPAYKAQRPAMAEALRQQLDQIPELAAAFDLPVWQIAGVEADDTIASLTRCCREQGAEVWLATSDKDLDQLIGPQVKTWNPFRDHLRGEAELFAERGISPQQVTDWLCLVGDSADNLPGIAGIGVKGARDLLKRYGTLDAILAERQQFSPRRQAACEAYAARHALMRDLVRVVDDLFCDVNGQPQVPLSAMHKPSLIDGSTLRRRLAPLGIPSARLIQRLPSLPDPVLNTVVDEAQWQSAWHQLSDRTAALTPAEFGLACHRHRQPSGNQTVCDNDTTLSLGNSGGQGIIWSSAAVPARSWLAHVSAKGGCVVDDCLSLPPSLRPLIADTPRWVSGCCRTASWLVDCDGQHQRLDTGAQPADLLTRHQSLIQSLDQRRQLDHYYTVELDQQWALASHQPLIQQRDSWQHSGEDLFQLYQQIRCELRTAAGASLNPRRRSDIAHLLFQRHDIRPCLYDARGPRVDDEAISALSGTHEIVDLVIQERHLRRLLDALDTCNARASGDPQQVIYAQLQRSTDLCGHVASRHPLLSIMPDVYGMGADLRRAFKPQGAAQTFISLRLEHLSLHLLAHLSGDQHLLGALHSDDPWRTIAALIVGRERQQVSPSDKRLASDVQQTALYRRSATILAATHGLSTGHCASLLENQRQIFTDLNKWADRCQHSAQANGFSQTLGGRKVFISGNPALARRQAIRTAIDGSAADLMLRLITRAHHQQNPSLRCCFARHSEALFTIADAHVAAGIAFLETSLEQLLPGARGLIGHGNDWLAASLSSTYTRVYTPHQRMTA